MPDPTLRLTFLDMQLRVAEYLGLAYYGSDGTEVAQAPTDTHDLELVKRLVNDGWRRFVNSNPSWHWLMPTFSITLSPDADGGQNVTGAGDDVPEAARYYMPDGFYGQMLSEFTYPPAGPRIRVENATEGRIRELFAGAASTTGDPYLAALRPLPSDVGPKQHNRRWEVIFFPTPDSAHTLTARCRLYPNSMIENGDTPNAGLEHDEAILAAALAEAERQREDNLGPMARQFSEALIRSIAMDQQTAPRRLGYNGDSSEQHGAWPGRRFYTGVDTYNGVSV